MPNNPTKILLLMTLISGILISVSSNSWIGAWMGLEINLLSFIPLMLNHNNVYTTESSLKYFIIQAMASSLLLFMLLMKALMEEMFSFTNEYYTSMIINTPLLLKSGAAPMHWWFPSVMEGLSWENCLLLMTIQKISPLMLISYQMKIDMFSYIMILSSVIVGSIGGLNQISLRKILTYSSINHTGWMLSSILIGDNLWIMYFVIYSMLTMATVYIIKPFSLTSINQLMLIKKSMPLMKLMVFLTLLSLGGLPPFLGFLPKWIVIQAMLMSNMTLIAVIMTATSILTLYYYLRLCYSSFIILHEEIKWNMKSYMNNKITIKSFLLSSMSSTGLILCTMIININ
uniref:NADH-ubiquinone oxidoreductase chain 2 n=1 Tax=Hodotermopsis sjostedti TaxID=377914 RepID=A0A0A7E7P3_9NEOP|nr:NADH dehydrogenase subunit 2 [Hodotermopsis sjostedti]